MPFSNVVRPDDLTMLTRVLDAHCAEHRITDPDKRHHMAFALVTFFQAGSKDDADLAAKLSDLHLLGR